MKQDPAAGFPSSGTPATIPSPGFALVVVLMVSALACAMHVIATLLVGR